MQDTHTHICTLRPSDCSAEAVTLCVLLLPRHLPGCLSGGRQRQRRRGSAGGGVASRKRTGDQDGGVGREHQRGVNLPLTLCPILGSHPAAPGENEGAEREALQIFMMDPHPQIRQWTSKLMTLWMVMSASHLGGPPFWSRLEIPRQLLDALL